MTITVGAVIVFFLLMGLVALARPERVTVAFGVPSLTPDGRNEVRAVYGGFGVAIAALLWLAWPSPVFRPGVFVAVAVALVGMAAGRLVAAAVERPASFYPCWFYFVGESVMAAILWWAARA